MPVEEPDPVTLAQEGSHHHEKNEKLNLTCRHAIHLLSLEPDVLQCFCGPAVVPRGRPVLPPASREIPAGDPDCGAMAR